jgi:hypothetical protein
MDFRGEKKKKEEEEEEGRRKKGNDHRSHLIRFSGRWVVLRDSLQRLLHAWIIHSAFIGNTGEVLTYKTPPEQWRERKGGRQSKLKKTRTRRK